MNSYGLKRTEPPSIEPVSLTEAKSHLRVDFTTDDAVITALVSAARSFVENWVDRSLITQEWELWMDGPPLSKSGGPWWDGVRDGPLSSIHPGCRMIDLPKGPLQTVQSITVYDHSDEPYTFELVNFIIDTARDRLILKNGVAWPSMRDFQSMKINYTAGFGDSGVDVPSDIRRVILMVMAHYYENRQAQIPESVEGLSQDLRFSVEEVLQPYKRIRV